MTLSTILLLAWLSILPPPQIGKLVMAPEYWGYTLEAAEKYQVSPYKIAGVMAIESRYNPRASSEKDRCYGLMQLDRGTARALGVDRRDPRENILGGTQVLARLLRKYRGNLKLAVRQYNGTGNRAYEREVLKAVRQAERNAYMKLGEKL